MITLGKIVFAVVDLLNLTRWSYKAHQWKDNFSNSTSYLSTVNYYICSNFMKEKYNICVSGYHIISKKANTRLV